MLRNNVKTFLLYKISVKFTQVSNKLSISLNKKSFILFKKITKTHDKRPLSPEDTLLGCEFSEHPKTKEIKIDHMNQKEIWKKAFLT